VSKRKGFCDVCGTEIEVRFCCSGHECGCMGQPIDPPVCSEKCWNVFFDPNRQKEEPNFKPLNLKSK